MDLIDRQTAIDAVNRLSLGETDAVRLSMRISDYLKRLPPAEPKTGKWIKHIDDLFPEESTIECDQYTVCDPDVVREDAYQQAFALMREVYDMTGTERGEAFSKMMLGEILRDASYDDLAKKLDAWKKEKEKIHIKDEVVQKLDSRLKFVVTEVHDGNGDTYISGVSKDGKVYPGHNIKNYKKTGVHVDDLDAYLEV